MGLTDRLVPAVDWFIPAGLRETTASLWQARIFVISHFLGPFSAVAILGYLAIAIFLIMPFGIIRGRKPDDNRRAAP